MWETSTLYSQRTKVCLKLKQRGMREEEGNQQLRWSEIGWSAVTALILKPGLPLRSRYLSNKICFFLAAADHESIGTGQQRKDWCEIQSWAQSLTLIENPPVSVRSPGAVGIARVGRLRVHFGGGLGSRDGEDSVVLQIRDVRRSLSHRQILQHWWLTQRGAEAATSTCNKQGRRLLSEI